MMEQENVYEVIEVDETQKPKKPKFPLKIVIAAAVFLVLVVICLISVAVKKGHKNASAKVKSGSYECFRNASGKIRERYTQKGTPTPDGEAPKKNPPSGYDCVFIQPAYVKTICATISGGGGGSSDRNISSSSNYKRLGGSAGEVKRMCFSAAANPEATSPYIYKIKIGEGGAPGQNGGESRLVRGSDTVILSVEGGIAGKDMTEDPQGAIGEKSGLGGIREYGAGGDANNSSKGGYIGITW